MNGGTARRGLFAVAVATLAWSYLVFRTGGFALDAGWLHVTSENYRRPAVIGLVLVAVALLVRGSRSPLRALDDEWSDFAGGLARAAAPAAGIMAATVAALLAIAFARAGFLQGSFVAGGSDSYGYLSQAHEWVTGRHELDAAVTASVSWRDKLDVVTPLAHRVNERGAIVSVYPPGYPLLMALFERTMGPRAVYWVVPLLGGLLVWSTYLLGVRLAGPLVGLGGAVMVATSPIVLFQLTYPMSDIPVAAWWTLALALAAGPTRTHALGAGVAAAAAVLTRPNLAPLIACPLACFLFEGLRGRAAAKVAASRAALFVAGVLPAFLGVAVINGRWYGSPWRSGYGTAADIYNLVNLRPNLVNYLTWFVQEEREILLWALASASGAWLLRRRGRGTRVPINHAVAVTAAVFAVGTLACYLLYMPFDSWIYLRYLLSAFPPVFLFVAVALVRFAQGLTPRAAWLTAIVLLTVLGLERLDDGERRNRIRDVQRGEAQYQAVGEYIRRRLPENAAVLSMQQSGSVRYYSGRLTVRYDMVAATELDMVIADLSRLGYHPYILLYSWEEPRFRERFQGQRLVGALDRAPVAQMKRPTPIRLYDASAGEVMPPTETEIIP